MVRQAILSREQDFGLIAESFVRLNPTVPKWVKGYVCWYVYIIWKVVYISVCGGRNMTQHHWVSCVLVTSTGYWFYYSCFTELLPERTFFVRQPNVKRPIRFGKNAIVFLACVKQIYQPHAYFKSVWLVAAVNSVLHSFCQVFFIFYHNWEMSFKTSICSYFSENLFLIPAVWISMLSLWLHSGYGTVRQQRRENKEPLENDGTLEFIPSRWCQTQTVCSATLNT